MLVTIEGIDGAGKSTLVDGLRREYPGFVYTREPTDGWTGRAIEKSVSADENNPMRDLFLFTADHANHLRETVKPALRDDKVVVCDRYIDSRAAYQAEATEELLEDGDEERVEWILDLHRGWSLFPDLTLLLDIESEKAVKRLRESRDSEVKFEKKKFLRGVRENYLYLSNDERYRVIDANREKQKVLSDCVEVLEKEIEG